MRNPLWPTIAALALALPACHGGGSDDSVAQAPTQPAGDTWTLRDTTVADMLRASGTAGPVQTAVLSTRLMGTVTDVLVAEGDLVTAGQVLVRIDSRELEARRAQVEAGLAAAQAGQAEAELHARRMRSLFADSAAPRAQVDAAETGLARAQAGVQTAQAAAAELAAVAAYATVRAPFNGIIVRRHVDPGAFAAPGGPLVEIEDASRLRVSVSVAPEATRRYRRGDTVAAWIEDTATSAVVEGIVPEHGNLYTVNALVPNRDHRFMSGSAATLGLVQGNRRVLLVPAAAIVRQGDLTGVHLATPGRDLRWIRLGQPFGNLVEVSSGLEPGDRVIVPAATGREE